MANKKHIEVKHVQITDYLKQKLIHMVYDNLCFICKDPNH